MRRLASQVPETVSRLLQAQLMVSPPAWYHASLSNPPALLPAKRARPRPRLDRPDSTSPTKQWDPQDELLSRRKALRRGQVNIGPREIRYEEDTVRRQFFRDFPFEALRPTSLVEMREVRDESSRRGKVWTKLEQRGSYPTVEDTIAFVFNLKNTQGMSISNAYQSAVADFTKLRARHEMSTLVAEMEARHYGAEFRPDSFERSFNIERKSLDAHLGELERPTGRTAASRVSHQKAIRWTYQVPREAISPLDFSGGRGYVQRWRVLPPAEKQQSAPQVTAKKVQSDGGSDGRDGGSSVTPLVAQKVEEGVPAGELLAAAEGVDVDDGRGTEFYDDDPSAELDQRDLVEERLPRGVTSQGVPKR